MSEHPETAINTRSGLVLDFAAPSPESIRIEDIAGGLSLAPRFGGQATRFRSVAEHAICVANLVENMGYPELALVALHHDSHEAYACDIPKPLKYLLDPEYTEITNRLDWAIATALKLPVLNLEDERARPIKDADDAMLVLEATEYLAGDPPDRDLPTGLLDLARVTVEVKKSMTPDEARDSFLAFHERLTQP